MVFREEVGIATKAQDDVLDIGTIVSLLQKMQIQFVDVKKSGAAKNGNGKKKPK